MSFNHKLSLKMYGLRILVEIMIAFGRRAGTKVSLFICNSINVFLHHIFVMLLTIIPLHLPFDNKDNEVIIKFC